MACSRARLHTYARAGSLLANSASLQQLSAAFSSFKQLQATVSNCWQLVRIFKQFRVFPGPSKK
eukprot:11882702-Alexandrium_andersonii.AAC.1